MKNIHINECSIPYIEITKDKFDLIGYVLSHNIIDDINGQYTEYILSEDPIRNHIDKTPALVLMKSVKINYPINTDISIDISNDDINNQFYTDKNNLNTFYSYIILNNVIYWNISKNKLIVKYADNNNRIHITAYKNNQYNYLFKII